MARNYTTLDQIVSDYIITMEGDDYANNVSDHDPYICKTWYS